MVSDDVVATARAVLADAVLGKSRDCLSRERTAVGSALRDCSRMTGAGPISASGVEELEATAAGLADHSRLGGGTATPARAYQPCVRAAIR